MEKRIFELDKVSGMTGTLFGLSVIPDILHYFNARSPFRFPFYGFSIHTAQMKMDEWIDEPQYRAEGDRIVEHIKEHGVGYFEAVKQETANGAEHLRQEALLVLPRLGALNDHELLEAYSRFSNLYIYSYSHAVITFIYESVLSERLHESLQARFQNAVELLGSLLRTPYTSFMIENERELLAIREAKGEARTSLIQQYQKDFFFMRANYAGTEILSEERIMEMAQSTHAPVANELTAHLADIELTDDEAAIVALFKETEEIRDQRKKLNLIGGHVIFCFLEEAARRRGVDQTLAKRAAWYEFRDILFRTEEFVPVLEGRDVVSCILDDDNNAIFLPYLAFTPRKGEAGTNSVKGTPASKGKVEGVANIIIGPKDFPNFKAGEILITEMTRPEFVPLMKIAKAIVTDEGGLTCHAAIVSRELGLPCIVGARRATATFKTGDLIEVNAETGVIRKL